MSSTNLEFTSQGLTHPTASPPGAACQAWPTMYDLPSEFPEEPGLPDAFHDLQPQLLSRTLQIADYSSKNWFTGSDLNVYYHLKQPIWHKRPDWFLAVEVPRLYEGSEILEDFPDLEPADIQACFNTH